MGLVKAVQANEITLEEAKRHAEKIDRRLGGIFDIASWSRQEKIMLFAAILGVAPALEAPLLSPPPVVNVQIVAPLANPPAPMVNLRKDLLNGTSLVSPLQPQKTPAAARPHGGDHDAGTKSGARPARKPSRRGAR
jgi:hypothetical protein